MKILFISDLHLDPERPDIQDCFDQFISSCLSQAQSIKALYILGDLFEVWIGDDASIPVYQHPINQLKHLHDSGIPVYVMHGNRDFLMAEAFETASGCRLIPDPYHLHLTNGETILLSHGDIFCTDDKEYMTFRAMVRDKQWQAEFLSQSVEARINIAKSMRTESAQRVQDKLNAAKSDIMDVNPSTVETVMLAHQVTRLIHGHTHRPKTHTLKLGKQTATRIVLPDWKPDAQVYALND
jgi:UDP-2,3-diacylglucosamine hydrolase